MDIAYAMTQIYLRKFHKWKDIFNKNHDKLQQLN